MDNDLHAQRTPRHGERPTTQHRSAQHRRAQHLHPSVDHHPNEPVVNSGKKTHGFMGFFIAMLQNRGNPSGFTQQGLCSRQLDWVAPLDHAF